MDTWFSAVDSLDQDWQGRANAAASSVKLYLAGRPVRLGANGSFALPRRACGKTLVAVDGAGGRTGMILPRCRRA
jgi:hypothetical protein